jgi:hypothetical protein
MSMNEGTADRIIRVVAGIVLLWLGFGGVADGAFGIVLGVVGAILTLTGLVGWCPLYSVVGVSTKRKGASMAAVK